MRLLLMLKVSIILVKMQVYSGLDWRTNHVLIA
jgi:hypothetical protein